MIQFILALLPLISTATPPCTVAGCSGEMCVGTSDPIKASICLYKPEYACYRTATCAVQPDGNCGWTPTAELTQCLNNSVACGNHVCEPGEADDVDCPVCEPDTLHCPMRPCYLQPGTCPADCPNPTPTPTPRPIRPWFPFPIFKFWQHLFRAH